MHKFLRASSTAAAAVLGYFFVLRIPFLFIRQYSELGFGFLIQAVCVIAAASIAVLVWTSFEGSIKGAFGTSLKWAAIVGGIGFIGGYAGPIIFTPDANQGPLLGIFITGPGGFVLGWLGGFWAWYFGDRTADSPPSTEHTGEAPSSKFSKKEVIFALGFAVAGYLALWLPWKLALSAGIPEVNQSNPIDGMQMISIWLLLLLGILGGVLLPKRFWMGGLFSMALFPIVAIFQMIQDPSSHNLWPLEFIAYGVYTIPLIFAGWITSMIVTIVQKMKSSQN